MEVTTIIYYCSFLQVEACRFRLYRIDNRSMDLDTLNPSAAWREWCKKAIVPEVLCVELMCLNSGRQYSEFTSRHVLFVTLPFVILVGGVKHP